MSENIVLSTSTDAVTVIVRAGFFSICFKDEIIF